MTWTDVEKARCINRNTQWCDIWRRVFVINALWQHECVCSFSKQSVWSELRMAPAAFFIAGGASIVSSRRRKRKTQISVHWRSGSTNWQRGDLTTRPLTDCWPLDPFERLSVETAFLTRSSGAVRFCQQNHFPSLQAKHTHIWWLEIKAEIIKNMQMTLFPFTDCHFLLEHCRKECWENVASLSGLKKKEKYKWNLFNISFVSHRYKWDQKCVTILRCFSWENNPSNLMFVSDFNKAFFFFFLLSNINNSNNNNSFNKNDLI